MPVRPVLLLTLFFVLEAIYQQIIFQKPNGKSSPTHIKQREG